MTTTETKNVLDHIVEHKREEVARAKSELPLIELAARLKDVPPPRGFIEAIARASDIALIAEVKKASPSAGLIRADFEPVELAKTYVRHGATCLSVLTDEKYFQGSLDYLRRIRAAVDVPLLRKEFVVDPYQILEAKVAGADAILLIAECLPQPLLEELFQKATELGLDTLIELHDEEHLERVLELGPKLVGVNNRDLKTMVTDLEQTVRLASRIPEGVLLVGESGIRTRADVDRLKSAGARAVLVGESLMREPDVGQAVDRLLQRTR
ncbi:MAG: indole-3-glycerol phosphate synthase TrpC [Planctomyces sp.]|nr:indole-3-glycerol phosphate synthase TrpC [Planctomyces sp.]